ncbi:bifunctional 2-keto-4-hydroxyglutarate aldolase/2-keto-3-deoxy-6-phosphogluconate aldolase [Lysinibacillus macroides]|uniref:Ketohydroxyglutarate aldolase n=1 Tax=Lysinibacillus macroides TaxID=33935 RepID=A0A0M9DF91_9BACI|nr:bifunctional 2-keto-4-hydroxyglutarate aldolase/2-keto-3-deoxy-6-phosphogluconate aldolase [Lysinibacillus macroides]KOY80278.1 ketohydroxyglutarate aldolase [Lysinibacillus macroides]QPR67585.1 bifunctional 2-keto-4-hydroxyglutarate aldolase/2-keto-3-deoxy-6-phosphogluconate aldolase [Lysinibacillus macroides]
MQKMEILKALSTAKVVAVVRGNSPEEATEISKGAIEGGIQAIELTYTTPFIEDTFKALRNSDALIGAGTVLDAETARHAILNGAKFVVSPSYNGDIAIICNRYSIPYLPGCLTIKEMVTALEGGSDIIKLFPASQFEPSFIKSVKGPLPNVTIMPTGGVGLANMHEWLDAGAVAVGVGSDLHKAYAQDGYAGVVERAKAYTKNLAN